MSDLAAAAAAMGLPESLVERSAAARAAETGASVDEIIAAWAGGAPPPAAAAAPEPVADAPAPEEAAAPEPEPEVPAAVIEAPVEESAAPVAVATAAAPYKAPVLVGSTDKPMTVLFGSIALFAMVLLMGFVGPSLQIENPGARTSRIPLTETGVEGQQIYMNLGCVSCHTQMVRPVVADVGLGAVTLNDSNQILGARRFGPDLSNVGARFISPELEAIVMGRSGTHPSFSLSDGDMNALVTYLSQSITAAEDNGEEEEGA